MTSRWEAKPHTNDLSMTMAMSGVRWAFLALFPVLCHASYILELGAHSKMECFAIHTPQNEKAIIRYEGMLVYMIVCGDIVSILKPHTCCSGDYDILEEEDEMSDVRVWLEDTKNHNEAWRNQRGHYEDQFSVTVPPQTRYALCFEPERNELDSSVVIQVGFNIRVHPLPRSLGDDEPGPDAKRALELVETSLEIEDDWESMLDHFDFLRKREAIHINISSEIMSRVLRWTLIEAGLVVSMATCQVLYWKKFFEQRRYL